MGESGVNPFGQITEKPRSHKLDQIELRFKESAVLIAQIQERVGDKTATEVARAALQFYNWATYEIGQGKQIIADYDDGKSHVAVFIPHQ